MSLINEALKKAQRQRSLEAAPLSSAPSGVAAAAVATHERAATRRRPSLAPLWFGLGLLGLGAGATALIMHYGIGVGGGNPAPTPAPAQPVAPVQTAGLAATGTPAKPAAAAMPSSAPSPVSQPPPPSDGAGAVMENVAAVRMPPIARTVPAEAAMETSAPVSGTATPHAGAAARPAPASTPTRAATATPVVARSAPPATNGVPAPTTAVTPVAVSPVNDAAQRAEAIQEFLRSARLTGVRGQGAQARVLMNERVYRMNDVVAPDFGLRLSAVRTGLLVFTDAQGRTYEKTY